MTDIESLADFEPRTQEEARAYAAGLYQFSMIMRKKWERLDYTTDKTDKQKYYMTFAYETYRYTYDVAEHYLHPNPVVLALLNAQERKNNHE